MQIPGGFGVSQYSPGPLQTLPQQTLSTQKPEVRWPGAVQPAPIGAGVCVLVAVAVAVPVWVAVPVCDRVAVGVETFSTTDKNQQARSPLGIGSAATTIL